MSMAQSNAEKTIADLSANISKEDAEKLKHEVDNMVTVGDKAKSDLKKAIQAQKEYGT
jgi:hypothetical protein